MQDEIVRAVTGTRSIPPHHSEATSASEAFRSAFCLLSTDACVLLSTALHVSFWTALA